MAISKERVNEIAHAMLIGALSKQEIKFDPEQMKRKLGNFPEQSKFLPKQFNDISKEELREALEIISHEIVEFAFSFSWESKKGKRGGKKKK